MKLPAESTGMHDFLIQAIQKRRILVVRYGPSSRCIEPYSYGIDQRDGKPKLRCWQSSGDSASGHTTGMKLLHVRGIIEAVDSGFTFDRPNPRYVPAAIAMRRVYAQVVVVE